MSIIFNTNAWIRYKTLDKCFSNKYKRYYFDDLLEECNKALLEFNSQSNGVNTRQLRSDLAFMKSSTGWNIELEEGLRDGKKGIYRYVDPDFSILKQPMNQMEAEQMRSALELLQRFSGMPQFDFIQEMIPKLEKSFNLNKKTESIIGFDDNSELKGRHFLGELYQHILNKNVLEIHYQAFHKTEPEIMTIHPYYLKQYNKRWYLFGWNNEADKMFNLPLDRVEKIETKRAKYRLNKEIDFNEYFDDIVGVTRPDCEKLTDIILHFTPNFSKYISTKPISPFERHHFLDDGTLEVKLKLIPNKELYSLLLSYGSNVKIIEPQNIADIIREEHLRSIR